MKVLAVLVALIGATFFQFAAPSFAQTFRAAPTLSQTQQVAKPGVLATAPTTGGATVMGRSAGGRTFGRATGGLTTLGAIECTADTCTCHGDVECNDMFSGAYCKWPTGPITPGDSCNNGVCTCKRI